MKKDKFSVSLFTPHQVKDKGIPKFYKESHEIHEMGETPEYEKNEHREGLEKRERRKGHKCPFK